MAATQPSYEQTPVSVCLLMVMGWAMPQTPDTLQMRAQCFARKDELKGTLSLAPRMEVPKSLVTLDALL